MCYLRLPARAGLPVRELLRSRVATAPRLLAFAKDDKLMNAAEMGSRRGSPAQATLPGTSPRAPAHGSGSLEKLEMTY